MQYKPFYIFTPNLHQNHFLTIGILNNGRSSEIIEPGATSYLANYPSGRFEIEPILGRDTLKCEINELLLDLLSK